MQCRVHLNDGPRTDWYSDDGNADRRHVAASGQAEDVTSPYDGAVTVILHGRPW